MLWRIAADDAAVHSLIEASDRAAAQRSGTPAPARRLSSTRALVAGRLVHVGTVDGVPVATVTVGPVPSFDASAEPLLPSAARPWYMQRLAVHPRCPDPLAGARAVRQAIRTAADGGADVLRAEANPDLPDVLRLLTALGFVRYGTVDTPAPRRTRLQRPVGP